MESTVHIRIQKFVIAYGAEQLISWLDHFDKVINSRDYPLYRKLEREACRACNITLADMHLFSNTACTNTKRIIAFVAFHTLHLQVKNIAILLDMAERTVNYYIKEAQDWINSPKSNQPFYTAYSTVMEKLNQNSNG